MALKAWWDGELAKIEEPLPKELTSSFMRRTGAGHFTQMSTDLIHKVGCAATICPSGSDQLSGALFLVCHYDHRQLIDRPIYSPGKTCSGCRHCDRKSGLCVLSKSEMRKNRKHDSKCKVDKEKEIKAGHKVKHPLCKKRNNKKGKHKKRN
uniref:SCP domain-containing protein n=1 Tax=Ditylenchus dipsaci TaxID=166011 RepID=A0A915ENI9_9BILA